MEILIIGNGFDLEHDLPTSYGSFLEFCKIVISCGTNGSNKIRKKAQNNWNVDKQIKERVLSVFKKSMNIVQRKIKRKRS